jgi:lysophospholipase L1-like esterase
MSEGHCTVVLLGDSLTEWGDFSGLSGRGRPCGAAGPVNHGVAGDTTWGILARLHDTTLLKPSWVFLQAGINDLAQGSSPGELVSRLGRICSQIAADSPGTRVGLLNLLPLCPRMLGWTGFSLNNPLIRRVNSDLRDAAAGGLAEFLDLYSAYADPMGDLPDKYTQDGLHLLPEAYGPWTGILLEALGCAERPVGDDAPESSPGKEGAPAR